MTLRLAALIAGGLAVAGPVAATRPARVMPRSLHRAAQHAAPPTLVRGAFNARVHNEEGVAYPYQLFVPRDYDPAVHWPVIVAIHGGQERGTDNVKQIEGGLGAVVRARAATFPAIVVFPQIPRGPRERLLPVVEHVVDEALREVNSDPRRQYLTGFSFGGAFAYELARRSPGRYAALVPVSTNVAIAAADGARGIMPEQQALPLEVAALRGTALWLFHGARDPQFHADDVHRTVQAFRAAGLAVRYTEYPDRVHDAWEVAYREPELWTWLFTQHR